jgi:glutamate dehydrogenase
VWPPVRYSRERNYPFWQSFTTGKSSKLGGVPHDVYGMTTRSVRAFTTGLQQRYGLKEEDCTKFMTGGCVGATRCRRNRRVVVS